MLTVNGNPDVGFLAFQNLQEGAVPVQQHPGHPAGGVAVPGLSQDFPQAVFAKTGPRLARIYQLEHRVSLCLLHRTLSRPGGCGKPITRRRR